MRLINSYQNRVQPTQRTGINYANPLSRKLSFLSPLHPFSGLVDYVRHQRGSRAGGGFVYTQRHGIFPNFGTSNHLDFPRTPPDIGPTTPFSIAWVQDPRSTSAYGTIINVNFGTAGTHNSFAVYQAAADANYYFVAGPRKISGAHRWATAIGAITNGRVDVFVLLAKGGSQSLTPSDWVLYRNGVLISQDSSTNFTTATSASFRIGALETGSDPFEGGIGNMHMWSRILTPGEIASFYENPWQVYAPLPPLFFGNVTGGGPTYTLSVTASSFIFTGKVVGLKAERKIPVTPTSFTFSGKTVGLRVGRKLAVTAGAFVFSGKTVGLTYTPGGGGPTYSVAWLPGSFAFSGKTVGLRAGRKLAVSPYAFGLNGKTVGLVHGSSITYTKHSRLLIDSVGGKVLELGDNVVNSWGTATRPATPKDKTIGFNEQTSSFEIYIDGVGWKSVVLS